MGNLIKSIKIKNSLLDIELPINSSKMILCGDSGTGKTYMLELLDYCLNEKDLLEETESTYDLSKIEVLRTKSDIKNFNPNISGRLVFIDRADYFLDKSAFKRLNSSRNLFYIVSRLPDYARGLQVSMGSLIILDYKFKDGVNIFRAIEYFKRHAD